ncbi:MAG: hypothetical protein SGJ20_00850 [Planctomycetota bacterium]|nr:hypothetical protein [Planctomycetota bacterium]
MYRSFQNTADMESLFGFAWGPSADNGGHNSQEPSTLPYRPDRSGDGVEMVPDTVVPVPIRPG